VTALKKNAADAPIVCRMIPATAGPTARAPMNCIELSRTASTSSSGSTSCVTNACHVVMFTPATNPDTKTIPTMMPGVARPLTYTPHNTNADTIMNVCVTQRMCLRLWRSA
jgi:hypothetical protein